MTPAENRLTWALRAFFIIVAITLALQGEILIAILPLLLATGLEYRASKRRDRREPPS